MSFYSLIVLEVKKEVYNRLFNHWVTEYWENYEIHRPENIFDTGDTFVMTSVMNHAPYVGDLVDWLSYDLGMDDGDFYIAICPESYTADQNKIKEDQWHYLTDHYEKGGCLEPSFVVVKWDKIDAKEGVTFTPYQEIYRRPEPANDIERRLDGIEKTLKEILDVIRCIADGR